MTAPGTVGEDRRVHLLNAGMDALFERDDDPDLAPLSSLDEAAHLIELLDRHDAETGVVRVNLAKQRALEADRDRLRGALTAALAAVELGVMPHPAQVEGWRLIAAGGG